MFVPTPVATSITSHFNLTSSADGGSGGGGGSSSSKAVAGVKASYDMATPPASPGLVTGDMLAALTANMYDGDLVVLPEVGGGGGEGAEGLGGMRAVLGTEARQGRTMALVQALAGPWSPAVRRQRLLLPPPYPPRATTWPSTPTSPSPPQ